MKREKNRELSKTSSTNGSTSKIELVNCPRGSLNCKEQLEDLNQIFLESNDYQHNKEYQLSIDTLKKAYVKTYDLKESTCEKCAGMFRETILESLECMHDELKIMSKSFLRGKRYQGSLILSQNTLRDLRKG